MKSEQNKLNTSKHKTTISLYRRNKRACQCPTETLIVRGNLSQKSLSGIVKREDVVLDSEYLETVFVAVPRYYYQNGPSYSRNEEKAYNAKYETLTPYVVPRSSQKLAQDDEFSLFAVTLFRRDIQEFSHRCRELKYLPSRLRGLTGRWTPRDFKYSDSQLSGETQEFNQASQIEEKLWVFP